MGRFTEDMGRLRDEIAAERSARHTLINDTRQEVTDAAHAFMRDLKDSVETLQVNFRETHADMAQAARADRNAFLARLGGAVADIRVEAGKRQATIREDLAESATASRAERKQAASVMRDEVAQLQDAFQRARGVMAIEVRTAGQSFVSDIVGAVAGIQRQTHQLVDEFAGERNAARQAWRGQAAQSAPPPPAPAPKMKDPVQAKPQVQAKAQAKSAPKAQYKAAADKELPEKSAMDVAMHLAMDDAEATRLPGKDVSAD